MTVTYDLVPVEGLRPADVERVRDIYEAGFPAWLRADFGSLLEGRRPGEMPLALTEDGRPVGFAMLRPLGATGWMYLRFFVVEAASRGRGLGGILWTHLTGWLRESGYSLLVFDVEDPDEPGTEPEEVQLRSRRIAFYRRHGAAVLLVSGYRTPHDDAGEGPWTPMRLMAAGLAAGDPPTATAAGLRSVVEAVYRHRWSLAPDHPQVTATQLTDG
jgi:GNAT superfamily N-acetyltransferase